jgi:hypothetical protein
MRLRHSILPFIAVAACAGAASAADATAPSAADLVASYTAAATARAKADAALMVLSQDLDTHATGVDAAKGRIDNGHQAANRQYDEHIQTEQKKGDTKDQTLIDACQAAKTRLDAEYSDNWTTRNDLDARHNTDGAGYQELHQALEAAASVETHLKNAHGDLGLLIQLYAQIEARAGELDAEAKAGAATYATLGATWDGEVTKATGFTGK